MIFGTILNFIEASTEEIEEPIHPGDNATEEEIQALRRGRDGLTYDEVNKTLTMMRQLDERKTSQDKQMIVLWINSPSCNPITCGG